MKRYLERIIALVIIVTLVGLAPVPRAAAFTIGEEREVGEKLLYTVRSAFDLVDDPDVTQYINELGRQALKVTGIQFFDYRFFVINDNEFNAFAAPSGLIFFYAGLISMMNSEDELLSVMAHEIGHISKRHLASRMEKGKIVGMASIGMALAALAFGSGTAAPTLMMGSLAAGQSASLHFSRQDEEEADLLAYGWLKKMGRNPEGQEKMLQTMRRVARYRSERLPQYLLTHPDSEARLSYVQSLLENERGETTATPLDEFEFFRFKYRVMAQTKDQASFRTHLTSVITNPRSTAFAINMAKYGLSQVDRLENNFDSSLSLIDEVIAAMPQHPQLLVDKAVIELAAGQAGQAQRTLETVLKRDRSNMYAVFTMAKALLQQGQQQEAERYLQELVVEQPEYPQVYFELGQIAANQRKNGVAAAYLGKHYLYDGKLELARKSFGDALRDGATPPEVKKECKELLKTVKRIEEG
ncbi:M48 family metalloprotease [Desulfoprunum benzoelyticum]|uniref:Putative Zn-dependent protease n=1 Tax=Desulfoprunum benzoelyticum TaxID=1506996 RepID=A0A840UV53_9BACT|nr:M48 family metalloprotease [Desulfoprunum benzoelyticum]MBB5346598.1 putative Zn-dependent protease [Desulfoprunum benzoelyticum]MBM9528873.1 M48 family metalloprotease [Desulfoprunum benzoelyticum]